jgi:hypothetical protein
VFAITVGLCFVPVVRFFAFAALALLVPAAVGSFLGWFFGGVRDEVRSARRLWRRHFA